MGGIVVKKDGGVRGFCLGRDSDVSGSRRSVKTQEEDAARLIGGKRHAGSGALPDLKSDASSWTWQLEAKQTAKKSFRLKLEWLAKISREARPQDKKPIVHLRFLDIPEHVVVESDWVVIPASVFDRMRRYEDSE